MGRGKSENQMMRLWHRHRRHTRNGRACEFKMRVSSLPSSSVQVYISHLSGERRPADSSRAVHVEDPPAETQRVTGHNVECGERTNISNSIPPDAGTVRVDLTVRRISPRTANINMRACMRVAAAKFSEGRHEKL